MLGQLTDTLSRLFGRKPAGAETLAKSQETASEAVLNITDRFLHASRQGRRREGIDPREMRIEQLWRAATPMERVLPENHTGPIMAQDDAITDYMNYGLSGGFNFSGAQWLGYPALSDMAQRGEYRLISKTYAKEMTRKWITIKSRGKENKSERIEKIDQAFRKFKVRQHIRENVMMDGLFGIGHLYIKIKGAIDDVGELKAPLAIDVKKIEKGSFLGLQRVEPIWTYPASYNASDPLRDDFFKPRSWYVMGKEVHQTRLLTIASREVPDFLKPVYSFGGLSLTQMSMPYVNNWLQTRQSVNEIIDSFSVCILLTNMAAALGGSPQAIDAIFARAEAFNNMRNNRGLFVLDKNSEEFSNVNIPLSGLDGLQAQAQEHMASIAQIPLVKLLGVTPSGLNASSDGEIRTFYDNISGSQEDDLREIIEKIMDIIQINEFGDIDGDITFDFNPLWQLDEAGQAATDKTEADIDEQYVNIGVFDPSEIRTALSHRKSSRYSGVDLDAEPPEPPPMEDPNEVNDPLSSHIGRQSVEAGGGGGHGAASGV